MGEGSDLGRKGVSPGRTLGWCQPLIWIKNRDCLVISFHLPKERFSLVSTESFAFSAQWLAVSNTTFSVYECSGVRAMAADACSVSDTHVVVAEDKPRVTRHTSHPPTWPPYSGRTI